MNDDLTIPNLTERENEVKVLILQGLNNKEIAEKLIISPHTSKAHVSNILNKYGAKNRMEIFIKEIEQLKSLAQVKLK